VIYIALVGFFSHRNKGIAAGRTDLGKSDRSFGLFPDSCTAAKQARGCTLFDHLIVAWHAEFAE